MPVPDPKAYLDGRVLEIGKAAVPPTDRGLLYGDGVFETVRAYEGHVFRLDDHLDRLERSADAIALAIPYSDEELADAIERTLTANDRRDGLARLTVTRGDGWGLEPPDDARLTVLSRAPPEREEPLELCLEEGLPPMPGAKTCNRLVHINARMRARARGFDDAVFVDDDRLVEATAANVFLVEGDALATPPSPPALDGVTRRTVLEVCDRIGIRVRREPISTDRVVDADDAFATSTGLEVHPVAKLGSRAFKGVSDLSERMQRAFRGQVEDALHEQR